MLQEDFCCILSLSSSYYGLKSVKSTIKEKMSVHMICMLQSFCAHFFKHNTTTWCRVDYLIISVIRFRFYKINTQKNIMKIKWNHKTCVLQLSLEVIITMWCFRKWGKPFFALFFRKQPHTLQKWEVLYLSFGIRTPIWVFSRMNIVLIII